MEQTVKYPVGQQSFEQLRESGDLYIDKTRYIESLLNASKYFFLGRPRRFGKSLFLSTLKCFFEGKRNLFKGLYIDSIDWDWEPYPVLLIDLNPVKYSDKGELQQVMENILLRNEDIYGATPGITNQSVRLSNLIERMAEQTGKKVVILIDEYDKPLVNNIHNRELFEFYRNQLAALYSNLKSSADYIRLVFLTGVSRFSKLSVFSALNNISDISFLDKYSAICGITEEELFRDCRIGISRLAEANGRSYEEECAEIKKWYDGYHFSINSPDIYNPYSVLNLLAFQVYDNYWIESGTPTLLLEQLKRTHTDLEKLTNKKADKDSLSGLDIDNSDPVALFYQTGYLTIKSYNSRRRLYQLGLPNEEVTEGFYKFILRAYANLHGETAMAVIGKILDEIEEGRPNDMMESLQALFAGVGHDLEMEKEANVRNTLLIVFRLVGLSVDAEYRTSDGRIDILIRSDEFIYIIEIKFDKSSEEALLQIEEKEYALPWSKDRRKVYGIGVNFSSTLRRFEPWIIKNLS